MRVLFIDLDGAFTAEIRRRDPSDAVVSTATTDVRALLGRPKTAFVSPANSLCFMDGGIDAQYRCMWPGVEGMVKSRVQALGFKSKLGRSYLPLASALAVDTGDWQRSWLIAAPTMWLPQDVSATRNAYCACLAALHMAAKLPIDELVVPALCCGYGKMAPPESAAQCMQALVDFRSGTASDVRLLRDSPDFRQLDLAEPQPRVYMNMEWQDYP